MDAGFQSFKNKGHCTEGGCKLLNETWVKDPELIQRARIVLVLFLSKKTKGELVELIMNWLEDSDLYRFCHKVLDPSDLAYIERRRGR
ncbi:MAG: hypothetical protein H6Q48_591 [Deltaproteobacteria bacterium]|nr:hypothetical protein [Deltaproteobacteria bacterium]